MNGAGYSPTMALFCALVAGACHLQGWKWRARLFGLLAALNAAIGAAWLLRLAGLAA